MICTLWLILLVISEWVRIFVHGAKKQQSLCAAALHKSVFKSLLNCTSEISMIMLCVCARAYTYCVRVCVCVSPTPQKNPWRRQYFPEVRPSVVRLSTAYVHLSVRLSPTLNLYISGMREHISTILITVTQYPDHLTPMTFKVMGSKVKVRQRRHRNRVNSMTREPLNWLEPELTRTLGPFNVMSCIFMFCIFSTLPAPIRTAPPLTGHFSFEEQKTVLHSSNFAAHWLD